MTRQLEKRILKALNQLESYQSVYKVKKYLDDNFSSSNKLDDLKTALDKMVKDGKVFCRLDKPTCTPHVVVNHRGLCAIFCNQESAEKYVQDLQDDAWTFIADLKSGSKFLVLEETQGPNDNPNCFGFVTMKEAVDDVVNDVVGDDDLDKATNGHPDPFNLKCPNPPRTLDEFHKWLAEGNKYAYDDNNTLTIYDVDKLDHNGLNDPLEEIAHYSSEKEWHICQECQGVKLVCKHNPRPVCLECESDDMFRNYCAECLIFEGEDYNDEWDSLEEVIVDVAGGMYEIGLEHGKMNKYGDRPEYNCQEKSLQYMYAQGYQAGQTKRELEELKKGCESGQSSE